MDRLLTLLGERQNDLLQATLEHLQISLVSLLIAIIISIPLAIFISNHKKLSEPVLQVTGIFQTIPSLALLGLLIPFLGIGKIPAVIALVVYGLFPIVQNTLTGLLNIDPLLEEASTAFGMTKWEKLKKFKLALALPVIMSGIRTASVLLIGTATLAALIGAGGLGSFILLGIDRNDAALILLGAISSAILAVVVNMFLKFLERQNLKVIVVVSLVTIGLLGVSFLGAMDTNNKKIVAAGKLGAEPEILINMYQALIEDETDVKVELKPNFGKTTFLYEALKDGSIDVYPEFTGTVTSSLIKPPMEGLPNDPEQVYEEARDHIASQDKLVLLAPMEYENTYALAVKRSFAEKYHLKTITDLRKVTETVRAGFTLEFADRPDGNKGLQSKYGLYLNVSTMEPSLRYQAIDQGNVDVVDVYSTDPEIITHDLVVLEDNLHLFPPYQGAPLLREDTINKYPEIRTALNKLDHLITNDEMVAMNYAVVVEGKSAHDVALTYLREHHLLTH